MSEIHQIYCTHCTYGSSALERREGDVASRVLGYSARSSSLELPDLRQRYRDVERFLYYYLPADTPPEEKLRLDAASAPRRLVYYPSINGLQVVGQISYRQQDTAGRPGSYFGHVVFAERKSGPWNVLDCLQLWGAHWADEDSPNLPFAIPPLKGLGRLRGKAQPIINDSLLLSFLQTPSGQPFDDQHGVIPERWKLISDTERIALLTDVLQGFLSLTDSRRESVLLVIEPALAALIFYGVVRLLPPGLLRDGVSFSTFEPTADRLTVTLAATTFALPEATDLKPEVYRGRGYVNNTFLKKSSTRSVPPGKYARLVVEHFLANGPTGVNRLLQGFEGAGANHANDLEQLAEVLELVPTLLDPVAPMPQLKLSGVIAKYLGRALSDRLASEPAGSSVLSALVGTPRHLTTLNLLATDAAPPKVAEHIQFLINRLPEDALEGLLISETVGRSFKIDALVNFIQGHKRFPKPCGPLWTGFSRGDKRQPDSSASLLPDVLAKLPDDLRDKLAADILDSRSDRFLLAMLEVCQRNPAESTAVRLVGRLIDRLDDDKLCDFLICAGSELAPDQYPAKETALCERLPELLKSLPFCGRQFDDRLSLLTSWLNHFPNVPAAENRLGQWRTLRAMLVALRDVSPPKPRMGFLKRAGKSPVDDAMGKKLAETVWRAMPDTEYPDDVTGDEKMRCLRQLVAVLLGNSKSLPDPIWWKIQTYYRQRNWPSAKQSPLVPISSKKTYGAQSSQNRSRRLRELAIFTALGLALLVLGLVVYQAGIGVAYKDTDPPPDTAQTEPAPTHKPRVAPNQHNATAKTTPTKAAPTTEQIAAQKPRVAVNEHNAPTKVTPTDRNLVRLSANSEVDAEICKAILRWNLWCTWRKDEKMIASKLASDDVNERWVAAVFARQQHFDLPDELINALGQPSVHVRRETRAALVQLAGNADFGPADNDDEIAVADAITRWTLWRKWRTDLKQIAGKLASADMNECWVAAVLARQERLLLPDEFIKLLTHPSVHVRREARRALVQLAGNVDFGPNANANAAQIQEAAKQWSEWRAEKIKQSSTARQAPPQKENTTVTLTYKALPEAIDPRLPSNPRPVEFVTYDTDTATATPAFTLYMPASVKQESGTKASVLTPVNSNSTLPPERLVLNNDTHKIAEFALQPKKRAVEFQWFKPRASDTDLIRKLRGCVLAINTGTQQRSFVALTNKVEQPILHFDDKGKATVDIGKEHAAAGTNILQYHIYNATVRQGEYVYTFEGTLGGEDAKLTPNGLAPPISASVKVELTGHFLYFRIRTDDAMLKKDLKEGKVTVTATFERTVEAANAPPLRVEDITIGVPQTNTGSARLDVSEATCHPELQWLIG